MRTLILVAKHLDAAGLKFRPFLGFKPSLPHQNKLTRSFSSARHCREESQYSTPLRQRSTTRNGRRKKRIAIGGAAVTALGAAYGLLQAESPENKIFDPPRFTPFAIIQREDVSPTCMIITVRPQNVNTGDIEEKQFAEWWQKGTWSVEVKQPQLQITRAYTPLPPREGDGDGDLRFLIRKELGGEVSSYLHQMGVGEVVQMRGPKTELELDDNLTDVVFLAGGTGIAPAMQVAHVLLEQRGEENKARIRIVWANRKREDCQGGSTLQHKVTTDAATIVKELAEMQQKHPENLNVEYVVDEEKTYLDKRKLSQLTKPASRVKSQPIHSKIGSQLLIISGPEGFITHFAGKKLWDGGQDGQGETGGVIGTMGLRGWRLWKM